MIYVITMFVLVLLAHMAGMEALREYNVGILTNFRKLREQVFDYRLEVKYVIIPGIKKARGLDRKLHKISAFGEEFVDRMPRLIWYTALYGTVFTIIGELI